MCSVTVLRSAGGWQVFMNRDERRSRRRGVAPRSWAGETMIAPQDPEGGGTWIAVTRDGLWGCLLNAYDVPDRERPAPTLSRGHILPYLFRSLDGDVDRLSAGLRLFAPFRLLVGRDQTLTVAHWDGRDLVQDTVTSPPAFFATSSSWREEEVTRRRRSEFRSWRESGCPVTAHGVPKLHLTPNAARSSASVLMSRTDAWTESLTALDIGRHSIRMRFWSSSDLTGNPLATVSMVRRNRPAPPFFPDAVPAECAVPGAA